MNQYTLFRQHILDRGIEYYEDGYPSPKQVKPKLKTAMRLSRVNIGIPPLKDFIQDDFYVIRGSQSLC